MSTQPLRVDPAAPPPPRLVGKRDAFLVFGKPALEQAEFDEIAAVLTSGWLGTGPRVKRFEELLAAYKSMPHAIGVSSCTAALHLSLIACDIGPGDEVITTPLTFCATVNAIIHAGATPVLADVDPMSMNIDPAAVEAKITPRTRAIIPVHFAGRACEMDRLTAIAERHGLDIIEDCAHAIETQWRGRPAGSFGRFGCFSFYATKNVTCGEGGMITCRRDDDAERLHRLRQHGLSRDAWNRFGSSGYRHYSVTECGYKYNMMDLQAALGIHQLLRVDQNWRRRVQIAQRYDEALADLPVTLPAAAETDSRHAHHLYTLLVDEKQAPIDRDTFLTGITAANIGVGVHYLAMGEHPYYQERFGWRAEDCPNAMRIGRQTVSLPLGANLSDNDVEDVIDAVRLLLRGR